MTEILASKRNSKKLVIRLSSLGDVILAMSALSVFQKSGEKVDWVVCKEYASLLEGHPAIGRVWSFDRQDGSSGWRKLCRTLWQEQYSEVFDLHRTLRSRLMRLWFFLWGRAASEAHSTRWRTISKKRVSLYGYFIFKALWPLAWRPDPMVRRSAQVVGGQGNEKPDLRHLLLAQVSKSSDVSARDWNGLISQIATGRPYLCVMPSSRWDGKKWPIEKYVEVLRRASFLTVVLGTPSDQESRALVQALEREGLPVVSAVGSWSFSQVAEIISGAHRYLGNDTGLSHLAEAVGVPAVVVFGPTVQDMGFGPWRQESRSVGASLVCRPCGKDGRYCFRLGQRFECMKAISSEDVIAAISSDPRVNEKSHQGVSGG